MLIPLLMILCEDGYLGVEIAVGPFGRVGLSMVSRGEALFDSQLLAERFKRLSPELLPVVGVDGFRCPVTADDILQEEFRDDGAGGVPYWKGFNESSRAVYED